MNRKKINKQEIIELGNPTKIIKTIEKTKEKIKKRYRILIQQKPTKYYKKDNMRSLTIRDYSGESDIGHIQDIIRENISSKKQNYKKIKTSSLPSELFSFVGFIVGFLGHSILNITLDNFFIYFVFLCSYAIVLNFVDNHFQKEVYIKK